MQFLFPFDVFDGALFLDLRERVMRDWFDGSSGPGLVISLGKLISLKSKHRACMIVAWRTSESRSTVQE